MRAIDADLEREQYGDLTVEGKKFRLREMTLEQDIARTNLRKRMLLAERERDETLKKLEEDKSLPEDRRVSERIDLYMNHTVTMQEFLVDEICIFVPDLDRDLAKRLTPTVREKVVETIQSRGNLPEAAPDSETKKKPKGKA